MDLMLMSTILSTVCTFGFAHTQNLMFLLLFQYSIIIMVWIHSTNKIYHLACHCCKFLIKLSPNTNYIGSLIYKTEITQSKN